MIVCDRCICFATSVVPSARPSSRVRVRVRVPRERERRVEFGARAAAATLRAASRMLARSLAARNAVVVARLHRASARRIVAATTRSDMSSDARAHGDGVSFGPIAIPGAQVFYETSQTFALVNLKPVVPGHVLVCPRRSTPKFTDLSDEEISDLWRTVAVIQRALEHEHDTSSSTLAIQDGPLAGQTVPHVHVHVLPRRVGDFARNDDVYDDLERWNADGSKALDDDRPPRSTEEMRAEADALRALF